VNWSLCSIRTGFALAVAFMAATLGDAVVEGLSNAGFLWRGHYTDNSSADLVPMCAISVAAFAIALTFIVLAQMRRARSRALPVGIVTQLLPAIFVLQMLSLLAMETIEQVVVFGHPLGGALWLGGPIIASLLTHGIMTIVIAFAVASGLTRLAEQVVRVARRLYLCLLPARKRLPAAALKAHPLSSAEQLLRSAQLAQRGPPAPAVLS
jgi:hypothetical protein